MISLVGIGGCLHIAVRVQLPYPVHVIEEYVLNGKAAHILLERFVQIHACLNTDALGILRKGGSDELTGSCLCPVLSQRVFGNHRRIGFLVVDHRNHVTHSSVRVFLFQIGGQHSFRFLNHVCTQ